MPSSDGSRVLIVDDHPVFRLGLARTLAGEPGIGACVEAESVTQALDVLRDGGAPDLMLVDISLQGKSGLDLVRSALRRFPDLSVLVCSMHDEQLFAERALEAGALGYVDKQKPVDEILAAVRRVLSGERYLSPRMQRQLRSRSHGGRSKADGSIECLSNRELEVFSLIGNGLSTRQISERLGLSIKTIETYRENVKAKLMIESGPELARRAVAWVLSQ